MGHGIEKGYTDILVTLSTFGAESDEPERLLTESGLTYFINTSGKRMEPREVVEWGRRCRGLVAGVEEYTAETMAEMPNLRCISRCGVGIDNIDLADAERRGITVLNTPEEPVIAVAEWALSVILALLRRLPAVNSLTCSRKWQRVTGNLLMGKTVGLIGLGRIGRRVAELVQAFGAMVIGTDPCADEAWARGRGVGLMDLPGLLHEADIVSIHAAHSAEHPFRLGAKELSQMKQGAWLINVSRGDMVDDVALKEALDTGKLAGAGLDVFPEEPYRGGLCDSDRVILTPHQATLTMETRAAMETHAVQNLVEFLLANG
jgi:D-3-phosphoglycerate dehydrogenase